MDAASRREELVRALRRSGPTTVDKLAERLEVSRRTVLRDLMTIRGRGFRVVGTGGRGGGIYLDPRSVLVSSQLAADEVVALVISVAVARAAPWTPFAKGAERALAKIEGALPPDRLRQLRRFMERILVGDPVATARPDAIDATLLPAFEDAFTTERVLQFRYTDRGGVHTRRRVEPHGLLVRAPLWYIIGWDVDKDAPRLFRMDRVRRPAVLPEAGFRPRPMELVTGVCPDAQPRSPARGE